VIVSQTPYRVSFLGGGTDLPSFYQREYGAVLSCAIDRHIYVSVNRRFEYSTRVSYTKVETVRRNSEIQHEIIRECLNALDVGDHLDIATTGDVPSGTGLGSSSALTVGLLTALHEYRGEPIAWKVRAKLAAEIEMERLHKPIGKQDAYASTYGGINYVRFNCDGSVNVDPIYMHPEIKSQLEAQSLLLYTGSQRDSSAILYKQSAITEMKLGTLRAMRDLAQDAWDALTKRGCLNQFAEIIDAGWHLKRSLGCGISTLQIDKWYEKARQVGAKGGKLLGAGGNGFLYLIAPEGLHEDIRKALGNPLELPFRICGHGSRIITQ